MPSLGFAANGSDCITGKTQYATKADAHQAALAGQSRGWDKVAAYRCQFCECYHTGNPRRQNTKSRKRR